MADEVRLWRIGPDASLNVIQRASLDLEARLQAWLVQDISVLDPELLVIGQEVETDFGGFIDLLCIDAAGDLVVVELKRHKTPREITAQLLDYGSWVADLSHKGVTSIAEAHLGGMGFERAFRDRFKADVPETLNGDHRLLVVGSQIDDGTERIIKYLSDKHGVNINAATFQYFRAIDGAEFLARVFLIEPVAAELRSRVKGTSKRLPNLTHDELEGLAKGAGVHELYSYSVSVFAAMLGRHTTRHSIVFTAPLDGSRKAVISLWPGESCAMDGLKYQLYKRRFAAFAGLTEADVEKLAPASRGHWAYVPNDPDFEGFEGHIRTREETDRMAAALTDKSRVT